MKSPEFHCIYCGAVEPRDSRCTASEDGEHCLQAFVPQDYKSAVLDAFDAMERGNIRSMADKRAEVERKARHAL